MASSGITGDADRSYGVDTPHHQSAELDVDYMNISIVIEKDGDSTSVLNNSLKNIKPAKDLKMCVHGRKTGKCIDCGGNSLCVHNEIKAQCKKCRVSSCPHGKTKYYCRECGGAGTVKHIL